MRSARRGGCTLHEAGRRLEAHARGTFAAEGAPAELAERLHGNSPYATDAAGLWRYLELTEPGRETRGVDA